MFTLNINIGAGHGEEDRKVEKHFFLNSAIWFDCNDHELIL